MPGQKRRTEFTVEAISTQSISEPLSTKEWIGINQSLSNSHVEYFMRLGAFDELGITKYSTIRREVSVRDSRIDFEIDGTTFLEVKTPLIHIPGTGIGDSKPLTAFHRIVKHFDELASVVKSESSTGDLKRGIFLFCFFYDAPPFQRPPATVNIEAITQAAKRAKEAGVQFWQANFRVTPEGIHFLRVFRLESDY
ncbi:hypothetical protein SpCBS45565_g00197 [Spizellomyces sp. 'palustris']|nr:hypothetical protein SpCBS45565_g00197 [Spizellomyces sp. 'palustris']